MTHNDSLILWTVTFEPHRFHGLNVSTLSNPPRPCWTSAAQSDSTSCSTGTDWRLPAKSEVINGDHPLVMKTTWGFNGKFMGLSGD